VLPVKNKLRSVITVVISNFFAVMLIYLMSCVPAAVQKSPEEIKAHQDSIRKAELAKNKHECLKIASLGFEYYKNKEYNRSVPYLWRMTRECDLTDPDFAPLGVYWRLADSYIQLNKTDSVLVLLELCVKEDPDEARCHHNLAFYYNQQGRHAEAVDAYLTVVDLVKESGDKERLIGYWKTIADLYLRLNQMDKAIGAYDEVLALNPDDQSVKEKKKNLVRGDAVEYKKMILEMLEKEPNNLDLLLELAVVYGNEGENKLVIDTYRKVLENDPSNIDAWRKLGKAYQNEEQYKDAVDSFQKIVKLDPQDKSALIEIADSYNQLNQYAKSRSFADKALSVDKQYGMGYRGKAEIYERSADNCSEGKEPSFDDKLMYQLAIEECTKALKDFETSDWASQRIEYLKNLAPQKGDYFFNKDRIKNNKITIGGKCYGWVKRSVSVPKVYR